MVIVQTAQTPTTATCCPSCGRPMRFVNAVPRLGALPELQTFECKACGVMFTEAVERGGKSDSVRAHA